MVCLLSSILLVAVVACGCHDASQHPQTVPLIFDTDMGNDVDDALALGMVHALQSRAECKLLAVTITKDEPTSAPFVDAINTFYGRPDIPIGVVRNGPTPEPSRFTLLADLKEGARLRFPHDLASGDDAREATWLLRKVLSAQPDHSVVIIQVGFSTNLARLLASEPDEFSALSGRDLVARKVRMLSMMAGAFAPIGGNRRFQEYNVKLDIESARQVAQQWPTPIVFSGFEVGIAIPYPAESIEHDFEYVEHHPIEEAYRLYEPPPHERPTWDLTSVLYAVRPDDGYFGLSERGRVVVHDDGSTQFRWDETGLHRYLTVDRVQAHWATAAMVELVTQAPTNVSTK